MYNQYNSLNKAPSTEYQRAAEKSFNRAASMTCWGGWVFFFFTVQQLLGVGVCVWRGNIRWLVGPLGMDTSDLSVHFRIMLPTSSPHYHLCHPQSSVQAITPTPRPTNHRELPPPHTLQAAVSSAVRYTHIHTSQAFTCEETEVVSMINDASDLNRGQSLLNF